VFFSGLSKYTDSDTTKGCSYALKVILTREINRLADDDITNKGLTAESG